MKSKTKKMVAYRFSLETVKILKRFAKKRKTTQTSVLETLVDRHCKTAMKKTAKILLALLIPVTTNAVEINGVLCVDTTALAVVSTQSTRDCDIILHNNNNYYYYIKHISTNK